jgi:salicylate hydroxylase
VTDRRVESGVKSTARSIVAPNGRGSPRFTGYAVYRATVDAAKMREIPEISWVLEQPNLNLWFVTCFPKFS